MFVMGLAFAIIGASVPNQTLLILGICFVVSSSFGFIAAGYTFGPWTPPEVAGPEKQLRLLSADDMPISDNATWQGDELEIEVEKATTEKLFSVRVPDVDQCKLIYRFQIQTKDLKAPVYSEMWCHLGRWRKFFSRGVDNKISGTNDWVSVEIPFYLQKRQVASKLSLNLVFEGPGKVRLKQIEVASAPIS